jgi:hypothetical protein
MKGRQTHGVGYLQGNGCRDNGWVRAFTPSGARLGPPRVEERRQARALLLPARRRRGAADGDHPDDDEARQLGAVVGGAYERPKIVEMALGELQIE